MKILFTNTTNAFRNSFFLSFVLMGRVAFCFQTEIPSQSQSSVERYEEFQVLEAGLATEKNVSKPVYLLGQGKYKDALAFVEQNSRDSSEWFKSYLTQLVSVSSSLVEKESEHFILAVPAHQVFLADYALPALEKVGDHFSKVFGHRPTGKIKVEIYPTKEDFSAASTLSVEILERSGAIGICKFHRLMILSPKALPLGYRWLDALSHEYLHLMINELSCSRAELWLHEGTARYFETSYRLNPPFFLTPHQQTALVTAREKNTLVSFDRMSPSMVYLKDQDEVSLAFAQVSYAVSLLAQENGAKKIAQFLKSLKTETFPHAFEKAFHFSPQEFEKYTVQKLAQESWLKSVGVLSDEVRFSEVEEEFLVGTHVQGRLRLGDRMRQKGLFPAALIEYEKALEEEPDNAVLLLKAARTHLSLDQKNEAIEKLHRATLKNPNYGTPFLELAGLVSFQEAVGLLLEANSINPFDPRIHKLLEEVYKALGDEEKSIEEGKIALFLQQN